MEHFYGMGGGWMMIIWWIAIFLVIFTVGGALVRSKNNTSSEKSALEVLRERYARGEIDKEEFKEKKKKLQM